MRESFGEIVLFNHVPLTWLRLQQIQQCLPENPTAYVVGEHLLPILGILGLNLIPVPESKLPSPENQHMAARRRILKIIGDCLSTTNRQIYSQPQDPFQSILTSIEDGQRVYICPSGGNEQEKWKSGSARLIEKLRDTDTTVRLVYFDPLSPRYRQETTQPKDLFSKLNLTPGCPIKNTSIMQKYFASLQPSKQ